MERTAIADWDRRFGISGSARVVEGSGGLPKVVITSRAATGEMYLHGAHVTAWQPRGAEEVLFVSAQSRWEDGRAIRGGVPVCFPWFADKTDQPTAPAHGLVRTAEWRLDSIVEAGDAVTVSMRTESNAETKKWTPADFQVVHRVTFGRELTLELLVTNAGPTKFRFEEALHTYLRVGDVAQTRLHGLSGVDYLDKTDSNRRKRQQGPIMIGSETDRVYLNTRAAVELEDPSLGRRVTVAKNQSLATIVWNPWIAKARAMSDFGDDEWLRMVCIETANVADFAIELPPGAQHTIQAIVQLGS